MGVSKKKKGFNIKITKITKGSVQNLGDRRGS